MSLPLDNKIKVFHLIGSTGLYGAERWVLALMRAMNGSHVTCTVVNLVDQVGGKSDVVAAAQARNLPGFDFYTGGKFNPFAALRLARVVKEQGAHVIHGHGFKSDLVGLLTARLSGRKVVTTPHGWSFEKDPRLQAYERLDRALFPVMDRVCPLSSDLVREIDRNGGNKKVQLIRNGVDLEEIQGVSPAVRGDSSCFSIGYIGQLIDRKDLPTLLAALNLLRRQADNARLTIIGDGPKVASLRQEVASLGIEDRVTFMGFRADAAAYLKTFDVFVLPSLMEGIPRCIMEAMACAVPVVVSDIPGNRELVVENETGLLFRPGDSQALADKLRYLMLNPAQGREMARRGRNKVEADFSNKAMAAQYTALYRELLGR